jgi:hypothetical protein
VVAPDGRTDLLLFDYEQTLKTYAQLAEIRFKLFAFVPTLSGAAATLLTKAGFDQWTKAAAAALGLVVTTGIVIYDQRNSQFYDGAIGRAQELEKMIRLRSFDRGHAGGLFNSRRAHPKARFLGVRVKHGIGTALIYAPALAIWAFALASAFVEGRIPAVVGGAVAVAVFAQLLWLDLTLKKRREVVAKIPRRIPRLTSRTGT